jgi:hypothetical protein
MVDGVFAEAATRPAVQATSPPIIRKYWIGEKRDHADDVFNTKYKKYMRYDSKYDGSLYGNYAKESNRILNTSMYGKWANRHRVGDQWTDLKDLYPGWVKDMDMA